MVRDTEQAPVWDSSTRKTMACSIIMMIVELCCIDEILWGDLWGVSLSA